MVVVTGAAGFIGSCLASKLNASGYDDLVLVDDFSIIRKTDNWCNKRFKHKIDRGEFLGWFGENNQSIDFMFHLGARTDTTETNQSIFDELNVNYSKRLWEICCNASIPLVYASSAATYGLGEHGFDDTHEIVKDLEPLNPYGVSKNEFDKWVLQQRETPPLWVGVKFFNVFGPNEFHKGRMASVVWHTYQQVAMTGTTKLFKSHRPDYEDGEQRRDFIYVKDVVNVLVYMLTASPPSGLYNLGTGQARTFLDLAHATFSAMGKSDDISFIDTPIDIRDKYQYFTVASMQKLRLAGYNEPFSNLEDAVRDYVRNHLLPGLSYL